MSRLPPGPDGALPRHGAISPCPESDPLPRAGAGWCLPCYEHGAFTLASGPDNFTCVLHGELLHAGVPPEEVFGRRSEPSRRTPRGRAARSPGPTSGPGRTPGRGAAARTRARALSRGRARARGRVRSGRYRPHPGWRNFIEPTHRVLVSQPEALAHVARRIDDEEWRTDKRSSWGQILRRLILHMDWDTGLIAGVTAEQLGTAGARAPRTVSRVLAWARDIGLLVVVECGASAEFLGTDTGRTPTYALVADRRADGEEAMPNDIFTPFPPVDKSGDPPTSLVVIKPLTGGRRPEETAPTRWPVRTVPDDPVSRNAATLTLLSHLGLGGRKSRKIEIWRARALLKPWWDSGACVGGLLHALEVHPDRPHRRRGNVGHGARDPLRVIGARLAPWQGRLRELPESAIGFPRPDAGAHTNPQENTRPPAPPIGSQAGTAEASTAAVRRVARRALQEHLDELRERRRGGPEKAVGLPLPLRRDPRR